MLYFANSMFHLVLPQLQRWVRKFDCVLELEQGRKKGWKPGLYKSFEKIFSTTGAASSMLLAHRASTNPVWGPLPSPACPQPTPLHPPCLLHASSSCQPSSLHPVGCSSPRLLATAVASAASTSTAAVSSTEAPTTQQQKVAEEVEKSIPADLPEADKERLRRERISSANKGRTTWNKGRKHRPGAFGRAACHILGF